MNVFTRGYASPWILCLSVFAHMANARLREWQLLSHCLVRFALLKSTEQERELTSMCPSAVSRQSSVSYESGILAQTMLTCYRKLCTRYRTAHDIALPHTYARSDIFVDNIHMELSLWDTAGQEEFDRLRSLSYDDTQAIMLCFSVCLPANLRVDSRATAVPHTCAAQLTGHLLNRSTIAIR